MANSESDDTMSNRSVQSSHQDAYSYYSTVQEQGLARRNESPILYSRNFTNWIKSTLIQQYLQLLKLEKPELKKDLHVFDMGCGKGGDIPKWVKSDVKSVVFADVAENLVADCRKRFQEWKSPFAAEFATLDLTEELLSKALNKEKLHFDLVSSQLVLHYSFERFEKANRFLRNAAEFLVVGGYFIGTTVNAHRVVKLCREAPNQTITNEVFSIRFDDSIDLKCPDDKRIPLFGAKYHFYLEGVVDCPEYLVHFPLLVELAKRHGLKLVDHKTFRMYFDEHRNSGEGPFMLRKIDALQRCHLSNLNDEEQRKRFEHIQNYFAERANENPAPETCRSISKPEWEVTSLYITFAFQKERSVTYDDNDNILS